VERSNSTTFSGSTDGILVIPLSIPGDSPDGTYDLRLDAEDTSITDGRRSVFVRVPLAWWQGSFLGLPVWIWLVILIGAIAAIGGGTAYVKFVGLGKLVECGECGAFIMEDSATCPKCGVEFEKDMAKCSNCQSWIPVEVKQCPECGVEFATGGVEMADYQSKMKEQYEQVKRRFREEASQELGRALTEKEFEDWWQKQPSFVTFEDWLKEEEEMRKMGSKPCPVCNTLNSVTAKVCHKCGTLLKEREPPKGGAPPARPSAPTQPQAPAEAPEGAEAGMPSEAIPKKVVKKPIGAPVVQKKVIKRPFEEKEDEGGEGEQDQI
jgi:RNA polymerase subunit RPABC4/transcription elongation factor Spt4/ribosomal protein L40E